MSDENEKKIIACPNCGGPAEKEGNKIVCERCDATFSLTRTGAAKVADVGRFQTIEDRLDKIESNLPGQEPEPVPPTVQEPDETDQSLLG